MRTSWTDQLKDHEKRLVLTCKQVILLNDYIRGLTKRYLRARAECIRGFRYSLRVRLAVAEGVRNVFYVYARDMAEIIAELRRDLFNQHVQIVTESDEEDEDYSDGDDSSLPNSDILTDDELPDDYNMT